MHSFKHCSPAPTLDVHSANALPLQIHPLRKMAQVRFPQTESDGNQWALLGALEVAEHSDDSGTDG